MHRIVPATAFIWALLTHTVPAQATWSIVAVEPATGEVGLAAATCGIGVEYIAAVVPGHGAIAAQAQTSFTGRNHARSLIGAGGSATQVLMALTDPTVYAGWFHSQLPVLQYGVATLNGGSADAGSYSGAQIESWYGAASGATYAVQGNMLRGADVVARSARAFAATTAAGCVPPLAERLLAALEAGRDAGGDRRCPAATPALSAVLIVARPNDDPERPTVTIVAPRHISFLEGAWLSLVGYKPTEPITDPVRTLRLRWDAIRTTTTCTQRRP